jgi:aldose sugar dehydrogenase
VHPWSLAFLPDGRLLVTELPGRLRLVDQRGDLSEPLEGLPSVRVVPPGTPVSSVGLHDVVLDPEFARNRRLYFSYFAPPAAEPGGFVAAERYLDWITRSPEERAKNPIGHPRVASARLSSDERRLEDVTVILEGGYRRLLVAPDGSLFVTASTPVGLNVPVDDLPQRLGSLEGKVLRISRDGSVPLDNPWIGQPEARPEIYAIGLRESQGAAFHPSSGQLWSVEHGPRGGDEINIIRAGANYGYPVISYGRQYSGVPVGDGLTATEGMQQPVYYWNPSIAPSGMLFYTGELFPRWIGDLFIGALAGQHLTRLILEGDRVVAEERLLEDRAQRIRDVRQGPDGALYVLTDEQEGRLLRIVPT